MASTSAVLLLLFTGLFTVKAVDDCKNYRGTAVSCLFSSYCCGSCEHTTSDHAQDACSIITASIGSVIGGIVFFITLIACCFCPCCCIYKMCRNARPLVGRHVTTVTNTNVIQQQSAVQAVQYPQYQPVPTQTGYSQPMQMRPYQGQPCAPGAPPPYHVATSPGYPTIQSAYDGGQTMYPMQPPAQPGPVYTPPETSTQPAYNPAYMQPPKTGY